MEHKSHSLDIHPLLQSAGKIEKPTTPLPTLDLFSTINSQNTQIVWLQKLLESKAFQTSKAILPIALGKGISGKPIIADMTKMPHLLMAGQTGSGKSIAIQTMILSLLFKFTPEQLRFMMIDPKVVELLIYDDIPHLLTPVITQTKAAINALRWLKEEMKRRLLLLKEGSAKNIQAYNAEREHTVDKLSYIVLIVDEFADLMMDAGKEVEEIIQQMTCNAGKVGIHLVFATQRSSNDVITDVVRTNFPSKIAFTVANQMDSFTILGEQGAETLSGRGDMLYAEAGKKMRHLRGAFISDENVYNIADNWRARGKPNYIQIMGNSENFDGDLDPLFDEVVEYTIETGSVSISNIQRRFSLGFNRAGRIVDQMEAQGIVSEPGKGGKREVLAR